MSNFSNVEFDKNFKENIKSIDQDGLNPNGIRAQVRSTDGSSVKMMDFTIDDDYDGCVVSMGDSSPKYVLETDDAIQVGMWLATRDYSFRELLNLADECADIIYNRALNLPDELRNIGWDDSLLGDMLDEAKRFGCNYRSPDSSDLQLDSDTHDKFVELINSNLRNRGINVNYPQSAVGIATFLRAAIMLSNKYYGPNSNNRRFHLPWISDILGSIVRVEKSNSDRLVELLLDSCDHAINARETDNDYAGSIDSKGVVDVVNIAYLLNRKLSTYDSFLLVSTISELHNNEERNSHDMINSWIRNWVINKEFFTDDACWGFEEPIQFIGVIKAAILTVLMKFPNWGSDTVKDFKVGEWNPITYNWIKSNY